MEEGGHRTPPQDVGTSGAALGGAILLQIDKQRVRVLKLTIFKLTLCSITKFEILVMQYEHNMKAPAALVFYACLPCDQILCKWSKDSYHGSR